MPDARKERLNIYLLKNGVARSQVLRDDAPAADSFAIANTMPFAGEVYVKRAFNKNPTWYNFVQAGIDQTIEGLAVRSAAALVVLTASERVFAVAFGASRHWIDETKIERRFGMIVTLNCVDPDHVRSVDREEFDTITRTTRSQTSVSASMDNFGLDVQRDLVRSVTGQPADLTFAASVTGSDNLILSAAIQFSELADKCSQALMHFNSTVYRERYPWIDNFVRVRDPILINQLDETLETELGKDEPEDVFLSPPNLLDTQEHRGYRYPGERKAFHDDLRLSDFFEIVLKRDDAMAPLNVQVEQLQKWKIRHYTTDEASASDSFSVYDAIVYETSRNNKLYTLTRGEWFEIDENYVTSVTNEIAQVEDHPTLLLPDARANEKEGPYNERAANESNGALSLLDKKLVAYGGGYSKMEVCDLLSLERDFVHVKSRTKSAALSHLFAQGLNSAQAFRDKAFRALAATQCDQSHRHIFQCQNVVSSDHSVTYAVITGAETSLHEALPFFSKQSLANASRELRNMGYKVYLRKIPIS